MDKLIQYYEKKDLLAKGSTNTKLAKNGMETYGLSLIPANLNSLGENLCKYSTKECRAMCLNTAGRGKFDTIQVARKMKADFFVQHRRLFIDKLYNELLKIDKKGKAAIRLNVISDVDWEEEFQLFGKSLKDFNNILFYGYTKNPFIVQFNDNPNCHYTFSFSGGNWQWCEKFLQERKANIAVVFKKVVPLEYKGYPVINGDLSDERYLDPQGVIVGLKFKRPKDLGNIDVSKFVVE